MTHRNFNIDLLRASAILMVLIFHVNQRWPVQRSWLREVTDYGEYGVDLFFVISGWLIGGLFWRELKREQRVRLPRFVASRMLRTIPPYLAALVIAWLGVWYFRSEPFSPGYLLFVQNYYHRVPFFLVSWSLCVEEHFYLVVPALLCAATLAWKRPALRTPLLILAGLACLVPLLCRATLVGDAAGQPFGYYRTATHLRFEGLLLGVFASALHAYWPQNFTRFAVWGLPTAFLLLVAVILVKKIDFAWSYVLVPTLLAALFLSLLAGVVERQPLVRSAGLLVAIQAIALSSYSLYLTHTFAMDAAFRVAGRVAPSSEWLLLALMAGAISLGGAGFYLLFERTTLRMRGWLLQSVRPQAQVEFSPVVEAKPDQSPPRVGVETEPSPATSTTPGSPSLPPTRTERELKS